MSSSFFSDLDGSSESQKKSSSFFSDLEDEPSRARSLLSALPKGIIKGIGDMVGPPRTGAVPQELGMKLTEKFLPTQKGRGAEEVLGFAGENIPALAMGEGGLIKKGIQAGAGALAKKGAKELNLPEWAQEIVNVGGMAGPSAIKSAGSKVLSPNSKQSS